MEIQKKGLAIMNAEKKHKSPESIVIQLKKLIKKIEQTQKNLAPAEITLSQARIIFPIVSDGQGYSVQELSNFTGVDKALVSRAITYLEDKGIVEREKVAKNSKITLTKYGRTLCKGYYKRSKTYVSEWLNGVSNEEMAQFFAVLDKLVER